MSAQAKPKKDVALIHGVTEDRRGLHVLRYRNEQLESGTVRPLVHGRPIHGEVVRLAPRPEQPLVCDVETQLDTTPGAEPAPASEPADAAPSAEPVAASAVAARRGPAQFTSERYRRNWNSVFGRRNRERLN